MGGALDWAALPLLCELHGVSDVEGTLMQLFLIRDRQVARASSGET
jgi:hypothetical protein